MNTYVILAAGGSGTRMGAGRNKIFLPLLGIPVLLRSIRLFDGLISSMVIVCRDEDRAEAERLAAAAGVSFPVSFVSGGATRQHSVLNGLRSVPFREEDLVLVHDAARCLTPRDVIIAVLDSCRRYGSGVPAVPAISTMKYGTPDCLVVRTVDRGNLFEVQTPQGFRAGALLRANTLAERDHFAVTDDASVMEHAGEEVRLVQGAKINMKITEKEDIRIAEALLSAGIPTMRVGSGYDVHCLTEGRDLILCGVKIPHTLGLLGHSDADVALHALMDAMLGAASLGDIGRLFPDTDDQYRGISSMLLLEETRKKIISAGYRFVNADITIVAQRPKLAPFIPDMVRNVCSALGCEEHQVNVKATTTEKLGFEGRQEGISAQAVCLLERVL